MNAMMRAPWRGTDDSSSPTATESATPVHRWIRESVVTGHGSRCRSSKIDSRVKLLGGMRPNRSDPGQTLGAAPQAR